MVVKKLPKRLKSLIYMVVEFLNGLLFHVPICYKLGLKLFKSLSRGTWTWVIMLGRLIIFSVLLLPGWIGMVKYWFFSPNIVRNVEYGQGARKRNLLDIYLPIGLSNGDIGAPVVIFVTGGAWIIGYKLWCALIGRTLSSMGVLTIVPDYRNFPQGDIEDMISDVKAAVKWSSNNVIKYGGDPEKIVLAGQSAGAHICMCALVDSLDARISENQTITNDGIRVPKKTATLTGDYNYDANKNNKNNNEHKYDHHIYENENQNENQNENDLKIVWNTLLIPVFSTSRRSALFPANSPVKDGSRRSQKNVPKKNSAIEKNHESGMKIESENSKIDNEIINTRYSRIGDDFKTENEDENDANRERGGKKKSQRRKEGEVEVEGEYRREESCADDTEEEVSIGVYNESSDEEDDMDDDYNEDDDEDEEIENTWRSINLTPDKAEAKETKIKKQEIKKQECDVQTQNMKKTNDYDHNDDDNNNKNKNNIIENDFEIGMKERRSEISFSRNQQQKNGNFRDDNSDEKNKDEKNKNEGHKSNVHDIKNLISNDINDDTNKDVNDDANNDINYDTNYEITLKFLGFNSHFRLREIPTILWKIFKKVKIEIVEQSEEITKDVKKLYSSKEEKNNTGVADLKNKKNELKILNNDDDDDNNKNYIQNDFDGNDGNKNNNNNNNSNDSKYDLDNNDKSGYDNKNNNNDDNNDNNNSNNNNNNKNDNNKNSDKSTDRIDLNTIKLFIGISGPYNLVSLSSHLQNRGLDHSILKWICRNDIKKYSPVIQLGDIMSNLNIFYDNNEVNKDKNNDDIDNDVNNDSTNIENNNNDTNKNRNKNKNVFSHRKINNDFVVEENIGKNKNGLNSMNSPNSVKNVNPRGHEEFHIVTDSKNVFLKIPELYTGTTVEDFSPPKNTDLFSESPLLSSSPMTSTELLMQGLESQVYSPWRTLSGWGFPPVALFHGTEDISVPASVSVEMAASLCRWGGEVFLRTYEGWAHTDPILEGPLSGDNTLCQDLVMQINRVFPGSTTTTTSSSSSPPSSSSSSSSHFLSDTNCHSNSLAGPPSHSIPLSIPNAIISSLDVLIPHDNNDNKNNSDSHDNDNNDSKNNNNSNDNDNNNNTFSSTSNSSKSDIKYVEAVPMTVNSTRNISAECSISYRQFDKLSSMKSNVTVRVDQNKNENKNENENEIENENEKKIGRKSESEKNEGGFHKKEIKNCVVQESDRLTDCHVPKICVQLARYVNPF